MTAAVIAYCGANILRNIIQVSYRSKDSKTAVNVVNAVVEGDSVAVEGAAVPETGWRLFEYVDRPRFVNWFADESIDTRDLVPDGWVRI